jgi:hypothetical protein
VRLPGDGRFWPDFRKIEILEKFSEPFAPTCRSVICDRCIVLADERHGVS